MEIFPLFEKKAIKIEYRKKRFLVISDLHLGIERQLFAQGYKIPSLVEQVSNEIFDLIVNTNSNTLVLLGDVKNGLFISERDKEICKFIEKIESVIDRIIIIKGNHDGWLEKIVDTKIIKEFKYGKVSFIHGHSWPSEKALQAEYLIMGHSHPAVNIDSLENSRIIKKCWCFIKPQVENLLKKYKAINKNLKIIVMPAFNNLLGGNIVNGNPPNFLSPILKFNFLKKISYHLLDGTLLEEKIIDFE
jgi:hypothetical protein